MRTTSLISSPLRRCAPLGRHPGFARPRGLRPQALAVDVDAAAVASALKGPTLSELLSYGQAALSLAGQAWHAVISPLAVFGEDHWNLNLLFYAAVLLVGYNLVVAAPKQ